MTEKLKDYQVLDVFCGGTFYKVKHKVTNKIFVWKAYNCSTHTDGQIQNLVNEVKIISKVTSDNLLHYYDTILHTPSKTLYFVLEYVSWQSIQELIEDCKTSHKYFAESFIWYLLLKLARVCKATECLNTVILQKCITTKSIYVGQNWELRINCFDLIPGTWNADVMRQIGDIIYTLCYMPISGVCDDKIKEFHYSNDLRDVVSFLTDDKNTNLCPDVVLLHPTVLANSESLTESKHLSGLLVPSQCSHLSTVNKCDSEKAEDLCMTIEPMPRKHIFKKAESPIYANVTPKQIKHEETDDIITSHHSLSPTLAALALELPGYIPRSRKPYLDSLENYNCAQRISEETFSQQWMTRLIALRQREESLNQRERDLIAKEIINSPATKIVHLNDSQELCGTGSNGITLPSMLSQAKANERSGWKSRRRHRSDTTRARPRRKSYAYEDLDSSLSADAGDSSMIVTATRITKDNMPRRNIFPEVASKKVHFTSSNPFVESDESVTLTFYELEDVDTKSNPVPTQVNSITNFKYLDPEKVSSEKRSAKHWSHSSPSKQAKVTNDIIEDINCTRGVRKASSKNSLISKGSNSSTLSARSEWSESQLSAGFVSDRTRSSMRSIVDTPATTKPKRKSLLPFKTPFKFKTSTKV